MERDIEANVDQYRATRLRSLCLLFVHLPHKHRSVPVPDSVSVAAVVAAAHAAAEKDDVLT